ncbi:MAG: signal peptidase II [Opitutaceae bacterium]|nr:signal peptidase II [Opitutaceae bacterium]
MNSGPSIAGSSRSPDSNDATTSLAPASPPAFCKRIRAYRTFWFVAAVLFTLDQVTKVWINNRLPLGTYGPPDAITVIDGFFNLVHVGNTGAAWSMFTGRSLLLACFALAALAAIYFWRHTLSLKALPVQLSFGLLCGGIAGNLVDRIIHKHVIDFLDFHFGGYIYPTFNVADSGICIGVAIYLIWSLRNPESAR